MEKITAYKRSFCKDSSRRLFLSRSGCKKHEQRCWLNPARKSCATCSNLGEYVNQDEPCGIAYKCYSRPDVVPFKQKIDNCPYWESSGVIFTDEEPQFNRPIERAGRAWAVLMEGKER